jgi:transcriptional regulator with XRE-family HTH domain
MQEKSVKFQLTDVHVRGGRALLKWSATELAEKSGLAPSTIVSWENGRHRPTPETRARVREVLEDAGVIFLNHGSPGVRLRAKD